MVLENGQLWNLSIFLNETFRRASSLRLIENECIVDGYCPHLMPATPIFQKLTFSKKVLKTNKFWTFQKYFFHSWSNIQNKAELSNRTLFIFYPEIATPIPPSCQKHYIITRTNDAFIIKWVTLLSSDCLHSRHSELKLNILFGKLQFIIVIQVLSPKYRSSPEIQILHVANTTYTDFQLRILTPQILSH